MKGIVKWVSAQKLSVLASFLILSYFNFKSVHKLDCHPLFRNEPALSPNSEGSKTELEKRAEIEPGNLPLSRLASARNLNLV